jgi:hypothetical protein
MLIGSDYYWEIVTGSICKIEGGPIAVHMWSFVVVVIRYLCHGRNFMSLYLITIH